MTMRLARIAGMAVIIAVAAAVAGANPAAAVGPGYQPTPGSLAFSQVQLVFTCTSGVPTSMTASVRIDASRLTSDIQLSVLTEANQTSGGDVDSYGISAGSTTTYSKTFPVTSPAGTQVTVLGEFSGRVIVSAVRTADCGVPTPAAYDPPTVSDARSDCDGVLTVQVDNPLDVAQSIEVDGGSEHALAVAPHFSGRVTVRYATADGSPGPGVVAKPGDTFEFLASTTLGASGGDFSALDGRLTTGAACSRPDTLGSTGTLAGGEQLVSTDGAYRAVMQTDGNLVVYAGARALWSTGTFGDPGATVTLQSDANVVVYNAARSAALWSDGVTTGSPAKLVMQTDGNLVEYENAYDSAVPVWSWRTGLLPASTRYTGSASLGPGETLASNSSLGRNGDAPNVGYALVMQTDGNLVEYRTGNGSTGGTAVWSAGTAGHPGASLTMQSDGNAVVYQDSRALWNTGTAGNPGAVLVINGDGNVVVYRNSQPLFAAGAHP